ncbi:MAG TPA: aminotransferase class III-fold pyridoxal phosphate-dependent enzyme, partial [Longimicrobiales bacterium]|nr:aminotransferase class III-fold pyridoxal phosphate-dependent enzyme [Longimicrobiales bacterium]
RWFASEHFGVVPDIAVVGKGLTGTLPLSAAIGSAAVMSAWPASTGEAIHTSTFLGNPIACEAALAQIATIEQSGLLERAIRIGEAIAGRTSHWARIDAVRESRGLGALQAVEFTRPGTGAQVSDRVLQHGIIVLAEGPRAEVLALTPPVTITDQQLETALDRIEQVIVEL